MRTVDYFFIIHKTYYYWETYLEMADKPINSDFVFFRAPDQYKEVVSENSLDVVPVLIEDVMFKTNEDWIKLVHENNTWSIVSNYATLIEKNAHYSLEELLEQLRNR